MGVGYNPRCVQDGLLLYLDAANRRSYTGVGTSWYDLSGNGNTGTLENGPVFSSKNSGMIYTDGGNDRIDMGTFPNLDLDQVTFEIFVEGVKRRSGGIVTKGAVNGTEIGLSTGYSNTLLVARPFYYSQQITYPLSSIPNGIVHIAYTLISNGKSALYINGIEVANLNLTLPIKFSGQYLTAESNVDYPLSLGVHRYSLANNGVYAMLDIYLFKLYNRSLSAKEVWQNFNATRSRFGI